MKLNQILRKISEFPITIESWFISAGGIILIRILLEHYSSREAAHFVLIDASTIVHYFVFFLAVLLFSTLILLFFSKISLRQASVITLFGFTVIWVPPCIDLLVSGGHGYVMHYLFLPLKELIPAFFTLFWSTAQDGITYGIRTEILVVIFGIFSTVYAYTKNISRSITAGLLFYVGIFVLVSLPSFIGMFQGQPVPVFFEQSINTSQIVSNSSYPGQLGYERLRDIGFNSLLTQVNLIVVLLCGALICLIGYHEKFKALIKNCRPERILHYSFLIVIGAILGGGPLFFQSWINVLSLFMTIVAFISAWMVAVCINDVYDKEIDLISNVNRPIPQGLFSSGEFYSISIIFFVIALVAAYASSMYGLFLVIIFSVIYYLYSAYPIMLKRHFIPGALSIGLASLSAFLAGFFLSSSSKELLSFPLPGALVFIIVFGLGSMVKDLKDYEGDKAQGIKTLPVLIGLSRSKIIIASLITLGLLGVSAYFYDVRLIVSAIVVSFFIWKALLAKEYKEVYFFIPYLAFLVIFILYLVI